MLPIETKLNAVQLRIQSIRGLYDNTNTVFQTNLNQAEVSLETAATKAKEMVETQMADVKIISAAQCLGLQLPIPDLGDVIGEYAAAIKGLADGLFFDKSTAYLDALASGLSIDLAIAKLGELRALVSQQINDLVGLDDIFAAFSELQDKMKTVMSMVGSVVGCVDNASGTDISQHWNSIDSILAQTNVDFKAGLDAVSLAKQYFSNPTDILQDAKARVTGQLNLDGLMSEVKNQLNQSTALLQ